MLQLKFFPKDVISLTDGTPLLVIYKKPKKANTVYSSLIIFAAAVIGFSIGLSIAINAFPAFAEPMKYTVKQSKSVQATSTVSLGQYETTDTLYTDNLNFLTPVQNYGQDAIDMAKLLSYECRGMSNLTEKACVLWTVLNRVDKHGSNIHDVLRSDQQYAFHEDAGYSDENYVLVLDVLARWEKEKNGETDVGRVLPKDYLWFIGDGKHNWFRNQFSGSYQIWDYSLGTPYGDELLIPDSVTIPTYEDLPLKELEQQGY